MEKYKTMEIRLKHKVMIAQDKSTGTDNIISNDSEFDLEIGQKVIVKQLRHMLVEIISIK